MYRCVSEAGCMDVRGDKAKKGKKNPPWTRLILLPLLVALLTLSGLGTGLQEVLLAPTESSNASGSAAAGFPQTASHATGIDAAPPRGTLSSPLSTHSNQPIPVAAVFTEPVSGFAAEGLSVADGTVQGFRGSGSTYTWTVVPTGSLPVTVEIPEGVCADEAGNLNTASNMLRIEYSRTTPGSIPIEGEKGALAYRSASLLPIPDMCPGGVSDEIVIAADCVVKDINVHLRVEHPWVGDLVVSLAHVESNTSVVLVNRPGLPECCEQWGCCNSNLDIVLDDEGAGGSVHDQYQDSGFYRASPPNFVPMQALSAFHGRPTAGTWRLTVSDHRSGRVGTLVAWGLHFEPGADAGKDLE